MSKDHAIARIRGNYINQRIKYLRLRKLGFGKKPAFTVATAR